MIYHVWNRANFRSRLFREAAHYADFLAIVEAGLSFVPRRVLAYGLMPNPWHLVLQPRADGDLARFLRRLTLTHTQRDHARTRTTGYGHVDQGRYKSLPVEPDGHFLALVRYVEQNAQRAALVAKAEDRPWSSAHARWGGGEKGKKMLSPWPLAAPRRYLEWLNQPAGKEEIAQIREAIKKNRPYGSENWVGQAVAQYGLENTLRNRGRPKKGS
jgi:REP-associated tyrosine transposase